MIYLLNKSKLAWRIRATFAGKLPPKEYITPDIRSNNPGWGDEIFNRVIEKLEFFIPTGHELIMSGFEQYNFFIEALQVFGKAPELIQAIWFCGKTPKSDDVIIWIIRDKKMLQFKERWGHEYNGGPTSGWKIGVRSIPIISEIRKI